MEVISYLSFLPCHTLLAVDFVFFHQAPVLLLDPRTRESVSMLYLCSMLYPSLTLDVRHRKGSNY